MKFQRKGEVLLYTFFNLSTRWGGWSTKRTPPFYPLGKDLVHILQEAVLAPGPVWTGAKYLAPPPTKIRSPDRPAHSDFAIQFKV